MKAMIFAAGLGTRLQPLTNDRPKALVEVAGKTLLQRAIERLKSIGITYFVVNIHHFGDLVVEYLKENDNFGVEIHISDERDNLMNTGGGLKKASSLLAGEEPILIYNVDVISDINLKEVLNQHKISKALATMVVRERETQRYLLFNNDKKLCGWERRDTNEEILTCDSLNRSDLNPFAFSGIQILSPKLIDKMEGIGSFAIIPSYLKLAKTESIHCYIDDSEIWMDLGKIHQLKKAEEYIKTRSDL